MADQVAAGLLRHAPARAHLNDAAVSAFVAAHVQPELPGGSLSVGAGPINASCDNIDVLIQGESGHGAYPQLGRDPILAISPTITGLHALVGRRVDPLRAAIGELVESTARAHGCRRSIEINEGEPVLDNDPQISSRAEALAREAGFAISPAWRSCGSDDFAYFGEVAPTAMAFAGLSGAPSVAGQPLHHAEFLPPDEAVGAVARAQAVLYLAAAGR